MTIILLNRRKSLIDFKGGTDVGENSTANILIIDE